MRYCGSGDNSLFHGRPIAAIDFSPLFGPLPGPETPGIAPAHLLLPTQAASTTSVTRDRTSSTSPVPSIRA